MGDLAVTVKLNGVLVDDRLIPVHSLVRIGESRESLVHFPGADIAVVRLGARLALRGRVLDEGEEMDISLGATQVHLRHTTKFCPPSALSAKLDTRFLVAAVLVMVCGSWFDAAEYWLNHQPHSQPSTPLAQLLDAFEAVTDGQPTRLGAAVRSGTDSLRSGLDDGDDLSGISKADGPRHLADDVQSGIGYYAWYRTAVPADDPQVDEAMLRFLERPQDPSVRRILAQAAYNRDDYETAAWHYRRVAERFPDDRATLIRLARAEKRLGFHQREIELYRRVLSADARNVEALSGLAVALVRVGRLDEAQQVLDALQIIAPMHPVTHVTVAIVAAWKGQVDQAVTALEQGFVNRAQLSEELQIELRRDIALEPAFHSLRRDWHLRAMLLRHLGAAAPRTAL
ncbi:MAG: tetratricopeptide repeat protein [Myxococcota bacterium]